MASGIEVNKINGVAFECFEDFKVISQDEFVILDKMLSKSRIN